MRFLECDVKSGAGRIMEGAGQAHKAPLYPTLLPRPVIKTGHKDKHIQCGLNDESAIFIRANGENSKNGQQHFQVTWVRCVCEGNVALQNSTGIIRKGYMAYSGQEQT